jgi:molecular chaperone GrpE
MSEESSAKEGLDTEGNASRETGDNTRDLLAEQKAKNDQLVTRLKYLQADFENYRKRTEKEFKENEDNALRTLVRNLLEVLDELELAVSNAKQTDQHELYDGLKMVQKKLVASLGSAGLSRIECLGKPFDPVFHEAVEKVDGKGKEDLVIGEIRPGYTFRGRVLRPSMVRVEMALKETSEKEETENE